MKEEEEKKIAELLLELDVENEDKIFMDEDSNKDGLITKKSFPAMMANLLETPKKHQLSHSDKEMTQEDEDKKIVHLDQSQLVINFEEESPKEEKNQDNFVKIDLTQVVESPQVVSVVNNKGKNQSRYQCPRCPQPR